MGLQLTKKQNDDKITQRIWWVGGVTLTNAVS